MSYALDIAELFRAALAVAFPSTYVACDLDDNTITRPALIAKATDEPLTTSGTGFHFTVEIHVESSADIAGAKEAHAELTRDVREALHGAGKATLLAAVNADGAFDFRGWHIVAGAPGIEGHHFRAVVSLRGCGIAL